MKFGVFFYKALKILFCRFINSSPINLLLSLVIIQNSLILHVNKIPSLTESKLHTVIIKYIYSH